MIWKVKLRAWLIDLVREAIRMEQPRAPFLSGMIPADTENSNTLRFRATTVINSEPPIDPSFEQMQADALKAQKEFYAPESA